MVSGPSGSLGFGWLVRHVQRGFLSTRLDRRRGESKAERRAGILPAGKVAVAEADPVDGAAECALRIRDDPAEHVLNIIREVRAPLPL